MEPNIYDSENPQEYIYDSELLNNWYWEKQNEKMLQR
jgi:hypothetical protein